MVALAFPTNGVRKVLVSHTVSDTMRYDPTFSGDSVARSQTRWTTNLNRVEIEINTYCNLRCARCDRSVPQAPTGEQMTLGQIERFVRESTAERWVWDRITVLGGEPTLHPDFLGILSELLAYRNPTSTTTFRIITNGFGDDVNAVLPRVGEPWQILNTHKTRDSPRFSAYNLAPIDDPACRDDDFSAGCAVTQWCGLGLTRYGFYACGAGASVDRVFGMDIALKSLRDVSPVTVRAQLERLCRFCGHFSDFGAKVELVRRGGSGHPVTWSSEPAISPAWAAAYEAYRRSRPSLSLY